jgi:hypothetical protein
VRRAEHLQSAQQQTLPIMAPCTASSSLDNVLRVVTIVQQIMTAVNAVESQAETIAVNKAVINLLNLNVHYSSNSHAS